MKSWFTNIPVVITTTFIKSAARKTNIKINQQFHWLSKFIFHLPILIMEARRNFSVYIESIAVRLVIYSTANKDSAVHPVTFSVLSRLIAVMRESYRPPIQDVSIRSGNIFQAPAFRRTFVDAMSRVLRYAGLSE